MNKKHEERKPGIKVVVAVSCVLFFAGGITATDQYHPYICIAYLVLAAVCMLVAFAMINGIEANQ